MSKEMLEVEIFCRARAKSINGSYLESDPYCWVYKNE